jgi:hypothetical protein
MTYPHISIDMLLQSSEQRPVRISDVPYGALLAVIDGKPRLTFVLGWNHQITCVATGDAELLQEAATHLQKQRERNSEGGGYVSAQVDGEYIIYGNLGVVPQGRVDVHRLSIGTYTFTLQPDSIRRNT